MLNLYDTLSKTIKPIEASGRPLRMYSCGPTVYDHAHIGNLRSFIYADVLRRSLEFGGQEVDWVMNITDVDDKTIKKTVEEYGANATPVELKKFTSKYTNLFLEDLKSLNIDTSRIRFFNVSDVIPEIQEFIVKLIDKGFAYKAEDGSTYFSIEKYEAEFGDYGSLVGKEFLSGKKVGARVAVDEYEKENLSDFALWKAKHDDDGQIFWDHEQLGQGRPGWHIECSVINAVAFNNQTTDIHTGGVDLIFPHHTNEIAQSQPLYKPFTNHWSHSEHLQINNSRMAKREKNYFTLADLQEKSAMAGPALRYLYLQSDFRSQQNFTDESFQAAINGLQRLNNVYGAASEEAIDENIKEKFSKALENNLNTAEALACLHSPSITKITLSELDKVTGFAFGQIVEIPEEVKKLVDERQAAREQKDFAKSDELRNKIEKLGYEVKDTASGQKITKK